MAKKSVTRTSGEGKAWWILGGLYEIKTSSEETDGALTIVEMTLPKGMGPPPHTHSGDETVYVLEGSIRYHIGDKTLEGGAGSLFYIPAGTWERFEPVSDKPARVLVIYTPGGIDKFFAEVGEPAATRQVPPAPSSPPDVDAIMTLAKRHGMDMRPFPG